MRKNQSGFAHPAIFGLIVIILVVAVGVYVGIRKPKVANREADKIESTLVAPLPDDLLSVDEVTDLANQEAPDTDLAGVELEQEDGTYIYKVRFTNGVTLYFNARSGTQVEHKKGEAAEKDDETIADNFSPSISFAQAREIALDQKVGETIRTIELEAEEGKVVYSVRFSNQARVDIDATTGAVVRTKAGKTSPKSDTSKKSDSSDSDDSDDHKETESEQEDEDDSDHGGSDSSGRNSGHEDN